tara:strand:+ start:2486 stop:3556 length:1071 start_codon:yes stop_codon:yes gene_type:complete
MNNFIIYLSRFFDPETAHNLAVEILSKNFLINYKVPNLTTKVSNLEFRNPIGLAAGFDKSAKCFNGLFNLGFSSVEIGTVTPHSQKGNSKPRVFRLNQDKGVVNRYGFNNEGIDIIKKRLQLASNRKRILGVNIGPNKNSKDPINDFRIVAKNLSKYCDYLTINISSPNTPGLRSMQKKEILCEVINATKVGIKEAGSTKPIFLKISPDTNFSMIEDIIDISITKNLDALIISNTTIERSKFLKSSFKNEKGGLSGYPLFQKSTKLLAEVNNITNGKIDLIGVGGVENADQAYTKILVGANLVQLYTGLLFQGPNIVKVITNKLIEKLQRDGFKSLKEAIGSLSYKEATKLNNLEK